MSFENGLILVALGANLPGPAGSPRETLGAALARMPEAGLVPVAVSQYHQTAPVPPSGQPDFINAVAAVETELDPQATVEALHSIEQMLGRTRRERWEARTLDLDLLAHGRHILPQDWPGTDAGPGAGEAARPMQLTLPHPRLHERAFVLAPLCDMAPGWRHPVLDRTAQQLLQQILND